MTIPNFRDQIKIVFFDIDDTLFVRSKDLLVKSVQLQFKSYTQMALKQ